MKTKAHSQSGIFNPRILAAFALGSAGVLLAMFSFAANSPGGMKTPSAGSAGASAFVDNHAVPLKGNAAAPASSMPLAPTRPAWSIVRSPNPCAVSGVTCTSASDCWVVCACRAGFYDQTLIEHWNGTEWSIVTSPNTSTTQSNGLGGVTCASASNCWAVGSYYNLSIINNQPHHTLIERWKGTAWSNVSSPNTLTTDYNQLSGVMCASAGDWQTVDIRA